jgi:hypothetical protein
MSRQSAKYPWHFEPKDHHLIQLLDTLILTYGTWSPEKTFRARVKESQKQLPTSKLACRKSLVGPNAMKPNILILLGYASLGNRSMRCSTFRIHAVVTQPTFLLKREGFASPILNDSKPGNAP